jgi:hypothetical protein
MLLDSKRGDEEIWTHSYKNSMHLILITFANARLTRTVIENVLSSTWNAVSGINIKIPWQCKDSRN